MKIKLNRLTLLNFKGIRSLEIKFNQVTNISGENATGKTTIFDAFLWLFFGKDSTDRKDFEIKTLDASNEPFHRMDHEVSASITADGQEIVIRRIYKENWVTKRGESEMKMAGHVQSFYWNDVPMKLEDYQSKVSGILTESIFKLITNTGYFNSLKWQDRRNVLMDIAGDITTEDVQQALDSKINKKNQHQWASLFNNLNAGKSLEEFQRQIAGQKTRIKNDMEQVPHRIDEAKRSLPDELDYAAAEEQLVAIRADLEKIDNQLMDQTAAQRQRQLDITAKMNTVQEYRNQRQQIEFDTRNSLKDKKLARENAIADAKRSLRIKGDDAVRNNADLVKAKNSKASMEKEQAALRLRYNEVNGRKLEFKEGEFTCPTCKREYEASGVEAKKDELTRNFNADKSKQLAEIQTKGKQYGTDIAALNSQIAEYEGTAAGFNLDMNNLKTEISSLEELHASLSANEALEVQRAIASNKKYIELGASISNLEEEINAPQAADNKQALIQRKRSLNEELELLRENISTKDIRKKTLERIDQLVAQERELAGGLADLEGVEFTILQFTKAKMDLLESRINGRFKLVKFKLFQDQINGGENPCCDTLIKGVPYSDANTASKINAGLDIINTLCSHYKAYAPVFVDNAESVNTLIPVNAQLIRLVVSKDKKLKIESPKEELFENA